MVSVFLSSYRNTRGSSRELEKAAETLTCQLVLPQHFLFSQIRVPILLLYFFETVLVGNIQGNFPKKIRQLVFLKNHIEVFSKSFSKAIRRRGAFKHYYV